MIYVSKDGELLKGFQNSIFNQKEKNSFVFSKIFGLIKKSDTSSKHSRLNKEGYVLKKDQVLFSFNLDLDDKDNLILSGLNNCQGSVFKGGANLQTPIGTLNFSSSLKEISLKPSFLNEIDEKQRREDNWMMAFFALLLIFMTSLFFYFSSLEVEEEEEVEEKIIETVEIKVVRPKRKVVLKPKAMVQRKDIKRKQVTKKVMQNNLAFLGVVGNNNNSKVLGGLKQRMNNVSAGAGIGGNAGSGGERLIGVGKGLKKTTVGNTGTKGLGGIGTKGAGGGAGGYGDVALASGNGQGIGSLSVSNQMVLEGGLDKNIIAATIAKYLNQIRACYEMGLAVNSALKGTVEVAFIINALGRLDSAKIFQSTLKNKNVESCITNKMMKWNFPKPKGGVKVDVNYPFILKPIKNS